MTTMRLFTDHPESVGESYAEHLATASGFGVRLVLTGFACIVHALLPFLFVKTGSQQISALYNRMVANRRHNPVTGELDFCI